MLKILFICYAILNCNFQITANNVSVFHNVAQHQWKSAINEAKKIGNPALLKFVLSQKFLDLNTKNVFY